MLAHRNLATQFPNAGVNPQGQPWGNSHPGGDEQQVRAYLGRFGYAPATLNEGPYTDAPRSTMAFGASTNPMGGNPLIVDLPRPDSASLYYRTTTLFAEGVHGLILSPNGIVPTRQTAGSAFRVSEMRTLPSMPVAYAYRGPTRGVNMVQSARITTLTHYAFGFDFLADLLNAPDGPWKLRLSLAQQNISALDFLVMLALTGLMSLKDLMSETWKHRLSQWQQDDGVDASEFLAYESRFVGLLQSSRRPLEMFMQELIESQGLYEESGSDTLIVGREIGAFVQTLSAYTKYFIAGPAGPERLSAYSSGGVLADAALPMSVAVIRPKMVKGYGTFNMLQSMVQTGDFIPFEDLSTRNTGAVYSTTQRTVFAYNGAADSMEEIPLSTVIANSGRFDDKTDYLRKFDLIRDNTVDSFYSKIDNKPALHRFFAQQNIKYMPHSDTVRIASVMAQNLLGTVTPADFEQALELLRAKAVSIGEYDVNDAAFGAYVTAFVTQNPAVVSATADDGARTLTAAANLTLPTFTGGLSTPLPPAMGNSVGLWLIHKAAQTSTATSFEPKYGFSYDAAMEISRAYTVVMRAQASLQNVFGQSGAGGQYAQALNVVSNNGMHAFLDMVIGSGIPIWASAANVLPAAVPAASRPAPLDPVSAAAAASAASRPAAPRSILPGEMRIHAANLVNLGLDDGPFVAGVIGVVQYRPFTEAQERAQSRIAANLLSSLLQLPADESADGKVYTIVVPEKKTTFAQLLRTSSSGDVLGATSDEASQVVDLVFKVYFNMYPTSETQGNIFTTPTAYKLELIRNYALSVILQIYTTFPIPTDDKPSHSLVYTFLTAPASPVARVLELVDATSGGLLIDDAAFKRVIDTTYGALFGNNDPDQNANLFANWSKNISSLSVPIDLKQEVGKVRQLQALGGRWFAAGNTSILPDAPPLTNPGTRVPPANASRIRAPIAAGAEFVRLPLNISAAQFLSFDFNDTIAVSDPNVFSKLATAGDLPTYATQARTQPKSAIGAMASGSKGYRQLPSYVAASQLGSTRQIPAADMQSGPAADKRDKLMARFLDLDPNAQQQLDAVAKMPSISQRALAYMFLLCPIRLSVITSMLSSNVPIPFTGFAMRCYIQFDTAGLLACKRGAQQVLLKDMIFTWGQHPQQQSFMGTLSFKVGFVGLDDGTWKIQHALITAVRGGFDLSIITGGDDGTAAQSAADNQPVDNHSNNNAVEVARGSVMMLLEPHINHVGANGSGMLSVDAPVLSATGTFEVLSRLSGGNIKNKNDRTLVNSAFHMWWFRINPTTRSAEISEGNAEQAASTPPNRFVGFRGLYETVNADGSRIKGKPPTGIFGANVYRVGITTMIRNKTSFSAGNVTEVW